MDRKLLKKRVFKGVVAFLLFAALAGVTYLRATQDPLDILSIEDIERREGKAVAAANPQKKDFVEYLHADSTLRAPRRYILRANLSEKVENVFVDVGDTVEAGLLLAEFRKNDIESDIAATETRTEEAKKNYARFQNLLERGVVSEDAVEARLTALQDARATLQKARSRLEFTEVRAPERKELDYESGGVQVSAREVDPGEYMSAGLPLITLTDMTVIEIEAQVPEGAVKHLSVGREIEFRLEGGERWRNAEIVRISPETQDPHRFFSVYARTENDSDGGRWLLRPGMYARVRIPVESRERATAIPSSALRMTEAGCCRIFVVVADGEESGNPGHSAGVVREVEIEAGLRVENWVEVVAPGMSGDELIILNPRLDIRDGDRVRVMVNHTTEL